MEKCSLVRMRWIYLGTAAAYFLGCVAVFGQATPPPSPPSSSPQSSTASEAANQDQQDQSAPSTQNRSGATQNENDPQSGALNRESPERGAQNQSQQPSQGQVAPGQPQSPSQPGAAQQPAPGRTDAGQRAGQAAGNLDRAPDASRQAGDRGQPRRQGQEGRRELGLQFGESAEGGLTVNQVRPESFAAQAGFQSGDRIISVDGQSITNPRQFQAYVRGQYGRPIPVIIERNGQRYTLQFMPRQPDSEGAWLGVYLQDNEQDQSGARIVSVYPSGPAARAGLRRGDIVQQINGQPVASTPDLIAAIEGMEPQSRVEFQVARNGQQLQVPVVLGSRESFVSYQQGEFQNLNRGEFQQGQDEYANVPPFAMQLEHDRRMAEQHQRIEMALQKLQEEVRQLREALNQQSQR